MNEVRWADWKKVKIKIWNDHYLVLSLGTYKVKVKTESNEHRKHFVDYFTNEDNSRCCSVLHFEREIEQLKKDWERETTTRWGH